MVESAEEDQTTGIIGAQLSEWHFYAHKLTAVELILGALSVAAADLPRAWIDN